MQRESHVCLLHLGQERNRIEQLITITYNKDYEMDVEEGKAIKGRLLS